MGLFLDGFVGAHVILLVAVPDKKTFKMDGQTSYSVVHVDGLSFPS